MLTYVCSVIDHRGCQNVVRTKTWHKSQGSVLLMFLPHFDIFCDLWLLNRRSADIATWNLLLLYSDETKKSVSNVIYDSVVQVIISKSQSKCENNLTHYIILNIKYTCLPKFSCKVINFMRAIFHFVVAFSFTFSYRYQVERYILSLPAQVEMGEIDIQQLIIIMYMRVSMQLLLVFIIYGQVV